jgi:hypothetical protein
VAMSAFASRAAAKMRGKDGSARDGQHVLLESPSLGLALVLWVYERLLEPDLRFPYPSRNRCLNKANSKQLTGRQKW